MGRKQAFLARRDPVAASRCLSLPGKSFYVQDKGKYNKNLMEYS